MDYILIFKRFCNTETDKLRRLFRYIIYDTESYIKSIVIQNQIYIK